MRVSEQFALGSRIVASFSNPLGWAKFLGKRESFTVRLCQTLPLRWGWSFWLSWMHGTWNDSENIGAFGGCAGFQGAVILLTAIMIARLTAKKAQAGMARESVEARSMRKSEQIDVGRSSLDKSSGTRG